MTKKEQQIEFRDKVIKGLELVYEKRLVFKKEKKSEPISVPSLDPNTKDKTMKIKKHNMPTV